MIIAERIYRNETHEQIGISPIEYKSRWITLQEFLATWNGYNFEEEYMKFLATIDISDTTPTVTDKSQKTEPRPCCEQEEDLTYGKMFSDLASSIKAIAKSGKKLVDNEEHAKRYTLCKGCGYLKKGRCMKCGCFVKIKTKFAAMKCPIGLW